jgi:hypothetical protein
MEGMAGSVGETGRPVADLGRELDALNDRLRRSQERMRELLEHRRAVGLDGMTEAAARTMSSPLVPDDPFGGSPSGPSSAASLHDPFADALISTDSVSRPAEDPSLVIDLREVPAETSPVAESDVWSGSRSKSAVRVGATSMTWATPGPLVDDPIWGPPTAASSTTGWTAPLQPPRPADHVWLPPTPGQHAPPLQDRPPRQDIPWSTDDHAPARPAEAFAGDQPDMRLAEALPGTTRPGWQSNLITLMVALVVLVVALVFVGAI